MATMREATPAEVEYFDALEVFQKEHNLTGGEMMDLQTAGLLNPSKGIYPEPYAILDAKAKTKVEEAKKNKEATKDAYKIDFTKKPNNNNNARYNTGDPGIDAQHRFIDQFPDEAVFPEIFKDGDKEYIKTNGAYLSKLVADVYEAGKIEQERISLRQQTQQLAPDMTGRQPTPEQNMFEPRTVSQDEMRAILYPEQAQQQQQAEQAARAREAMQELVKPYKPVMSVDDMVKRFGK